MMGGWQILCVRGIQWYGLFLYIPDTKSDHNFRYHRFKVENQTAKYYFYPRGYL